MGLKSGAVMRPSSLRLPFSLRPVTHRQPSPTKAAMTTRVVATDAHEGPVFLADENVKAFDVVDWCRLENERVFLEIQPGYPDGLKTDAAGHVYVSSSAGVQVFDPDGMPLDVIPVRDSVNFAFAGDALLITNDTAIWKADLK